MRTTLQAMLADRPCLLADGATGTNYFQVGLQTGDAPELWNTEHPDRVRELHQAFVDAGADIILTNSFGGNRHRLKLHQAHTRVAELNTAAAKLASGVAADHSTPVLVAGSMGPTGELVEPLGKLSHQDVHDAYAEQAQALAAGGVDLLWLETLSAKEEAAAALSGAASAGLPIIATLSFDTNGRTMMGISPNEYAHFCREQQHAALVGCGGNCGVGPAELVAALIKFELGSNPIALVAKANCGIPQWVDGEIVYDGTPELMAEYLRLAVDAGAQIVGGCCGTTPAHLASMRAALDTHVPGEKPMVAEIIAKLGQVSFGAEGIDNAPANGARSRRSRRRRSD